MNRRDLLRNALAGAVASCLKWWPMPAAPIVPLDLRGEPIPDMAEDFETWYPRWGMTPMPTVKWREATPFEARWGFPEPHGRS